jgi:hypothetical protein
MGKISKNGRSNNRDRFFAVPHYILNTPAWKQFSVSARATWLEFGRVHNGLNNGRIAMSARFLGDRLGLSHDSAAKAIRELVTFGFLEVTRASSFSGKRCATEYRLTHIKDEITGEIPSRAFQNIWKSEASPCQAKLLSLSPRPSRSVRSRSIIPHPSSIDYAAVARV